VLALSHKPPALTLAAKAYRYDNSEITEPRKPWCNWNNGTPQSQSSVIAMQKKRTRSVLKIADAVASRGYRLDDQVGFQMRRAYQRASANLSARLAPYELTPPQFATLARIYERGRVSQNLLGRLVVMEPANIYDVVSRLKKRKLIRAEKDASDKRLNMLSLTPAGLSLFETLSELAIESTAQTLAPLRPAGRRTLLDLLRRVADG
jgi:DNA-binding MarR family transcriptional regulator